MLSVRTPTVDPTDLTPCGAHPAGWDIPPAEDRCHRNQIIRQVRAALNGCYDCPLRVECLQLAYGQPPEHECVQGGEIWPGMERRRGDVDEQRRHAAVPVPYRHWRPRMIPPSVRRAGKAAA